MPQVLQEKRGTLISTLYRSLWSSRSFRWSAIAGVHLVLPFLLFGGPLLDGTSSFFAIGHDALEQSYSWMQLLTRSLHQGFLPLWDPYTQGGHTFVGEIQAGVFYPVSWLFAFAFGSTQGIGMPALEAWVGVHFAVASLGFYWFAREAGGSRVAAFAGAILFAYFGPVAFRASAQVGIFFGLCWMPWALAFAWRFLRSGRRLEAFACGLVVGMQVVAGHIQPAFHTVLLICSLILFARWASGWRAMFNRKSLAAVALFGAGIAAVSLPQLLLAIQYLSDAYRWVGLNDPIGPWQRVPLDVFLAQHIITPLTLLSIVNPWQFSASDGNILYLGLAALLLCMTYLFRPGTKGVGPQLLPVRGWNLSVMVISLLLAMGSFGMIAMLIYPVPLMTAVRELGRYVILFHFAAAFVMVLAVDRLVRTGELQQRARSWPWWFVAVVAGYSAWLLFYRQTQVIRPVAIQLAGVAGALMILKWLPRLALGALFVNIALCAFITRDFVLPTLQDGRKLPTAYFPDSPILRALHDAAEKGRILIEKDADLPQNYGMVTGIESKFGYSATYYRPYFDFISQDWNINSRVNDLLNVRWVISKKSQDLPLLASDPVTGSHLYERPTVFPRVWLASDTSAIGQGVKQNSNATIESYASERISIRVKTSAADELILSEVAYPGWCASVDGVEIPASRVTVGGMKPLFRAAAISGAGDHLVVFTYRPWRCFRV